MRCKVPLLSFDARERLDERLPSVPLDARDLPRSGAIDNDGRGRYRTSCQRDRDRVLYTSGFQRLGGVTQVTGSEAGHTFHTRLTHSLKVAQVARRLAEKLLADRVDGRIVGRAARTLDALDPDAVETAGLAHDLGHPPFGHVAEEVLRDETPASFEGNAQSFRVVTALAVRSIEAGGLSLTRRSLDGILKYPWLRSPEDPQRDKKWGAYETDAAAFTWTRRDSSPNVRSLTAQIMDWADDVTYAVHDLEDFYRAGLVPLHTLWLSDERRRSRAMEYFKDRLEGAGRTNVEERLGALEDVLAYTIIEEPYQGRDDQRAGLRALASRLITEYLEAFTLEDGDMEGFAEVVIDDGKRAQVDVLKDLTWVYVVMRPELAVMQAGRREIIKRLSGWYFEAATTGDQRLIPPSYQTRLQNANTEMAKSRLVNDLVSGLTEDSALALFRRMSGVDPGSIIDAIARAR